MPAPTYLSLLDWGVQWELPKQLSLTYTLSGGANATLADEAFKAWKAVTNIDAESGVDPITGLPNL